MEDDLKDDSYPAFPRCRTCRHWTLSGARDDKVTRDCKSPKITFAVLKYEDNLDVVVDKSGSSIASNGAGVMDGEGYWAGLVTGPDFGCIHHEAR